MVNKIVGLMALTSVLNRFKKTFSLSALHFNQPASVGDGGGLAPPFSDLYKFTV
jgi:hypothetical protein